MTALHRAPFAELSTATLHDILRLRIEIFVVEQSCPYAELDGRDTEPGTRHLWVTDGGTVVAYLRMLDEPDGSRRIGRVCVARSHRGRGLARQLVLEALNPDDRADERVPDIVLAAQVHLADWYARLGLELDGEEFVEDGIRHVPMRMHR